MVQKMKKKGHTAQKHKRWSKGQSSLTNPDVSKYREKARSKFSCMQRTSRSNEQLTLDSLMIHNEAKDSGHSSDQRMEDDVSLDGQTVGTCLSGLSDCTNVTFRKIQRYWQLGSAKQKEACAIVAAITEVIRQQGEAETDTAYFAALATALDTVEDLESVSAVTYLLSLTCKRVPEAVLRAKFAEVSKLLMSNLSKHGSSSPTTLVRSTMVCFGIMLRSLDIEDWSHSSTMNVYQTLLSQCFFTKPKIRKVAQNSVCAVLKASSFMTKETRPEYHPAAVTTAKHCIHLIEKTGALSDANASTTCHAITLLGEILHCFPSSWIKSACETILKLMMLSQPVVKLVSFQAFYAMFKNHPEESKISVELSGKIVTALYDHLPTAADFQLLRSWLAVISEAIKHLVHMYSQAERKNDVEHLVLAHINAVFKTCLKLMESGLRNSSEAAWSTIMIGLDCLKACKEHADANKFAMAVSGAFNFLEQGLQYKYHPVRDLVLKALEAAYKMVAIPEYSSVIQANLISMANLRDTLAPMHKAALDKAFGAAITSLGPKMVLEIVPLLIDGTEMDQGFQRSWMLPLLKHSIKNSEIAFFTSYFLPLAANLRIKAMQLLKSGSNASATIYDTLQYQIWSLLPNFCDGAKDISTSFPVLARTLGSAIVDRDDIRPIAMQALRNLITSCNDQQDRETIGRFAKNYLPILFNLYTKTPSADVSGMKKASSDKAKSPDRLAALETIRLYLRLAEEKAICSYFCKAQERVFNSPDESDATRLALLDLLICMVGHVNKDSLQSAYQDSKPMLSSPNPRMQKKAYRLLNEIFASSTEVCLAFVDEKLPEIKAMLIDNLASSSPSSKGARLKCIESILKLLGSKEKYTAEECITFLRDILPEVILCTRDKKKVRVAAFSILVTAGNTYCEIAARITSGNTEYVRQSALREYFEISMAGLGGSVVAITASICALSRLIYEFKSSISSQLLDDCIDKVCVLLGTNTRQITKSALGFVTVLLTILDRATLAQHLNAIIGALFEWKSETRRHFRFKVKKILERFVRKFGFDVIYSMVPKDHQKQLSNLKKTTERKKRQQNARQQGEPAGDDDDTSINAKKSGSFEDLLADSDSEEDIDKHMSNKKNFGTSWLAEGHDEPVNLLEQSVSRNIIASDPRKYEKMSGTSHSFATAADGRMIIGNESDEDAKDDEDDALRDIGVKKPKELLQKRRKAEFTEPNDKSGDILQTYEHGGKGIHRKIDGGAGKKGKKGDTKKDASHEPYSYIPLKKSALNKRKRKKLQGEFDGLVRAAKKGGSGKGKRRK